MSTFATEKIRPAQLPTGFQLRRRIDGTAMVGFTGPNGEELLDQVTLIHTRGRQYMDWRFPLTVHVTSTPDARLFATENRPGVSVDVGIRGVKAIYHDGWWTPPVSDGSGPVWGVGAMHSLTLRSANRVVGVRAPREVPLDELVRIAKSVPPD
ncbi:MAG: hypothetical protein V7637_2330 [Mycobacteriales bacterium]